MKRILITGGSGLVGKYLNQKIPSAIFVNSKEFNLTNQNDVETMFIKYSPTSVIHLAAKVGGIIDNIEHPVSYLDDNILMNTLVLKYAYKYGVERFLSVLSCCAFPEFCSSYPMKECDMHSGEPDINTFSYGLSKRVMAIQIENYNKEFGTKYNYITPCNLYGISDKNSESKSHFITSLMNKIKHANQNGENTIELFGDGTPIRQLMYAKDLADVIKIIIDNDITESFNVAGEEVLTIDEIARIALKSTNSEHIKIVYDQSKPNGQMRKDLSIEKFKKIIPNYNSTKLFDGLFEYYKAITQK